MNAPMLEKACELVRWQSETDVLSIYTALQQVRNPRHQRGRWVRLAIKMHE